MPFTASFSAAPAASGARPLLEACPGTSVAEVAAPQLFNFGGEWPRSGGAVPGTAGGRSPARNPDLPGGPSVAAALGPGGGRRWTVARRSPTCCPRDSPGDYAGCDAQLRGTGGEGHGHPPVALLPSANVRD